MTIMNKKILAILVVVVMISVASAQVLFTKEKTFPKEDKDLLDRHDITNYTVSPIRCSAERCEPIRLKIKGVVDQRLNILPYWNNCTEPVYSGPDEDNVTRLLKCLTYERVNYTNLELATIRDTWEDEVMQKAVTYLREKEAKESEIFTQKVEGANVAIK